MRKISDIGALSEMECNQARMAFEKKLQHAAYLVERLSDRSAESFCFDPARVSWQEVGDLGLLIEHLESALEVVTPEALDIAS